MTHNRISAALIDMDGTLYNSMPNHAIAWMHLMDDLHIDAKPEEFFLLEGATGAHIIDVMFQRQFGRLATDAEHRDLYARKAEYFVALPPVSPIDGTIDLVNALRERDIDTILVTGSGQNSLLNRLEQDFPGAFPPHKRVTSASVKRGKPAPDPYLKGLEIAGVAANQALAIDNAPLGTQSAVAAGILTVGVKTGPIPADKFIDTGAHLVYSSMCECATLLPRLLDQINY